MWRYLAGAAAAGLLVAAGMVLQAQRSGTMASLATLPAVLPSAAADPAGNGAALPDPPAAPAKSREEKRFGRYDKDRNGQITRDEYLAPRHKAFAKLDKDGNGQLSFDEWGVKTATKFAAADADKSGAMTAAEFLATAPKRKARSGPNCVQAPGGKTAPDAGAPDDKEDDGN